MHRIAARLGGALGAATVAALAVAVAPVPASGSQSFSVRPAHHDPADPATRAYFKPVVAPGGSFSDEVVVANPGDQPLTFFVSGVDGLTAQTTGAVYANRQDPVGRTGAWIATAASTVTVAAGSEASVPFTVRVPADATPGDHLGGVAFESAAPQSSGTDIRITQVVRAVVGVSVRVPGPAAFSLRVGDLRVRRMEGTGTAAVFLRLANEGRALGKPQLAVTLEGPGGHRRTVARALDTVLPGDEVDYPLLWPEDLAPGRYTVRAVASGPGTTAEAEATVDFEWAPPETTPPSASPSPSPAPAPAAGAQAVPNGGGGLDGNDGGARTATGRARERGWEARLGALLRQAVRVAVVVAREAAFPLGLVLVGALFLFVQDRIDRRDPKLALAPVQRARDLRFPTESD